MPENEVNQVRTVRKIKPGDRFGDLTVLSDTGKREKRYIVWKCQCKCGNKKNMSGYDLLKRGLTDCGCKTQIHRKVSKIKPGSRFGQLTVLSDSGERKNSSIIWNCRCECGNDIRADTNSLHRGRITDCGCISSQKTNLMGQKFGKLTVIGDEGIHNKDHVWKCQCECGNQCLSTTSHLTHGENKSCGCLHDTIYYDNLKLVAGTSVTKLEKRRGKLNTSNTSGYNGVYPHSGRNGRDGRWRAQIGFQGKKYNLGTFDRLEDAVEARRAAERQMYDGFLDWYYRIYLSSTDHVEDTGKK